MWNVFVNQKPAPGRLFGCRGPAPQDVGPLSPTAPVVVKLTAAFNAATGLGNVQTDQAMQTASAGHPLEGPYARVGTQQVQASLVPTTGSRRTSLQASEMAQRSAKNSSTVAPGGLVSRHAMASSLST